MGIKDIYFVQPIKKEEAREWLLRKHYAHKIPPICYAYGLYGPQLIGVCTFGMPPTPTFNTMFYPYDCLELNRLVLNDDHGKNATSFFVSHALKLLPCRPLVVVSYADATHNHIGYVYQCTNWIYTGETKSRQDAILKGTARHPRHAYDKKNTEKEYVKRSIKHRYFYFLGSKKQRKEMLLKLPFDVLPYPKGNSKHYDASYQPATQGLLFI